MCKDHSQINIFNKRKSGSVLKWWRGKKYRPLKKYKKILATIDFVKKRRIFSKMGSNENLTCILNLCFKADQYRLRARFA